MSDRITIIKQNAHGQEDWRWEAAVLQRNANALLVEAHFIYKQDEVSFHGITLRRGDPFVEFYSSRCWYNIFEMCGQEDNQLKGWYCNVTRPMHISADTLIYDDLALDLLVYPDGRQLVLDEDEFAELSLSPADNQAAVSALQELQAIFSDVESFNMQALMG